MIATRSISLPLVIGLFGICLNSQSLFAQDDDAVVGGVDQPRLTISEQQFDQTVFNTRGAVVIVNGVQRKSAFVSQTTPMEQAKSQIETFINAEIVTVDLRCKLTDAQKKKLRLAGRGDIADFMTRALELRQRCTSKPLSQQEYTAISAEMQGLRMVLQTGSISDSTLLRKTLRSLLTDEQAIQYRALERERRVVMITGALAVQWGQKAKTLRLVNETQKKLVDVLLEHGRLPTTQSPYRLYIVLLEISRLEDRIKPLLSDEEWEQLQFPLSQAKLIEPFLRTSGQLPGEAIVDEISINTMKE